MNPDSVSGFWGVSFPEGEYAYLAGGNGTVVRVSFAKSSVIDDDRRKNRWSVIVRDQNISVQSERAGEFRFYISNVLGEWIDQGVVTGEGREINIEHLPAGTYFLHIEDSLGPDTYPFLLIR